MEVIQAREGKGAVGQCGDIPRGVYMNIPCTEVYTDGIPQILSSVYLHSGKATKEREHIMICVNVCCW